MANIDIPGRLHSIATGNTVVGADEVLDDNLSKKQSQINSETYGYVQSISNALADLSPQQQGALEVSSKANNNEAKLGYYVCTTEGNLADKTIAASNYILSSGGAIKIKMEHASSANGATLNINSTGKKTLLYNRQTVTADNTWEDGEVISVYYDPSANNNAGAYFASNAQGGGNAGKKKIGYTEPDKVLKCNEEYIGDTGVAIGWQYAKYPVSEGDIVIVTGTGGGSGKLWAIARSDGYILSRSDANASENGKVLVMPANAGWIVLNSTTATAEWYYAKAGSVAADAILGRNAKNIHYDNSESWISSDNVAAALNEINAGTEEIDFVANTGTSSLSYWIVNNSGLWAQTSSSNKNYCRILKIDKNSKYRITAKDTAYLNFALLRSNIPVENSQATDWNGGNPISIQMGETIIIGTGEYEYLYCRYSATGTIFDYPKKLEKLCSFQNKWDEIKDIKDSFDSLVFSEVKYTIAERNKYINSSCVIATETAAAEFVITEPIQIKKGDLITIKTKGGLMYVLAEYSNGAIARGLVFSGYTDGGVYREYSYIAEDDMAVIACGINDSISPLKITAGRNIAKRVEQVSQYHFGIYLYPFKAIVGKPVTIYKESVVSGLSPLFNYYVTVGKDREDVVDDYGKYSIRVNPTTEGIIPLTVQATDQFNNTITKTVNVTCRNMPSAKLSNTESIDVMFLGDSMIAFNHNLIGEEWRRMLATDDSTPHVDPVTKAIQLPTYNVCPNKIHLVGENYKASDTSVRYCYAFNLNTILTGKRSTGYSPTSNPGRDNPFYNRNSANPDTIGEDGFNQRVDFNWYFDNACGVGKYPNLFYIAAGVNDIGQTWNWSFDGVKPTTELLLKVIKKIKSVCDERAGGNSGVRFKVFNHQTYPLYNNYHYENPLLQQRLVWNRLYDCYQETIKNPANGVSEYVDFVDCASKFDWRVGYTQEDIATNVRYDGNQDVFIGETCHMNNVGSFNYADCLIDDFLADSYFD